MTDLNHEWLMEQPAATLLLAAYAEGETRLPKRPARQSASAEPAVAGADASVGSETLPMTATEPVAEESDSADNAEAWVPRVRSIDGVDAAQLSQLHGGLIARGFLKFEVFGRQIGMRYRLTPDGRRAAEQAPTALPAESAA